MSDLNRRLTSSAVSCSDHKLDGQNHHKLTQRDSRQKTDWRKHWLSGVSTHKCLKVQRSNKITWPRADNRRLTIGRLPINKTKIILLCYLSYLFRLRSLFEDSYLLEGLQSADKTKTHPKAQKLQNAPTFIGNGSHSHVSKQMTYIDAYINIISVACSPHNAKTTTGRYQRTNWPISIVVASLAERDTYIPAVKSWVVVLDQWLVVVSWQSVVQVLRTVTCNCSEFDPATHESFSHSVQQ